MRTIGIDPGTATMGWGVLDARSGQLQPVEYGAITTPARTPPAERLLQLHTGLRDLLQQFVPDAAAVEELFFSRNVTTALAVGQARGVILLTCAQAGIPVYEYKPLEVKQAVVGYGGADKRQMQEMVRLTLNLQRAPRPDDTADALAVAICHAYSAPLLRRVAEQS
jgi:crossover junction endodeoxyribonuclease RuvC